MIRYRAIKIISKLPPFWITNKEIQGRKIHNQMKTTETKTFLISFDVFNFTALDFPCSICRKAGISKYFFLFRTLSYITLVSTFKKIIIIHSSEIRWNDLPNCFKFAVYFEYENPRLGGLPWLALMIKWRTLPFTNKTFLKTFKWKKAIFFPG